MGRSPRRTFAASFVVTLAACGSSSPPPAGPQPPPQPQPDTTGRPVEGKDIANPPPPIEPPTTQPTTQPPTPQPPSTDHRWFLSKKDGKCTTFDNDVCKVPPGKPIPPCNPPPPRPYTCPDGIADGASLTITQAQGATDCFLLPEMPKCPPKAACNPPPPRKVTCP